MNSNHGNADLVSAFHRDDAEVGVFAGDRALELTLAALVPSLGLVHVLELDNDVAIGWRNATQTDGLVKPAGKILAAFLCDPPYPNYGDVERAADRGDVVTAR